jgi:hypothetical protein
VQRGLLIGEDAICVVDDDGERNALDVSRVGRAKVADLRAALLALSTSSEESRCWQIRRGHRQEPVALILDPGADELCASVDFGVDAHHDPGYAASVVSMLRPVVERWSARIILDDDPLDRDRVLIVVDGLDRTVAELVDCAADAQALLEALDGGRLTFTSARDLILSGHAGALVGAREGAWLDAKGAPYPAGARGSYELAKDAAAFANAGGGLVLIPATTRTDDGAEVITKIRPLERALAPTQSWTDVIAHLVYPPLAGVQVVFVGEDRGQIVVIVPAQPEQRKPFLVRSAVQDGRAMAHAVTIPWRDGDQTRFDDIEVVHAALQAQRRAARVNDDVLERVHLAAFPPDFADVVADARAANLRVDVAHDALRIHLPHGLPIDVLAADLHPKIVPLALHSLLERLAPFGIPIHRTSRGFLTRRAS